MQDLVVGERYYVKHGMGAWEGFVTFDGWHRDLMKVKDIELIQGGKDVREHYERQGFKTKIGGTPEWWGFELVNFSLENE